MSLSPSEHYFYLEIPRDTPLGTGEKDFSNVTFGAYDMDGKLLDPPPEVYIVPHGRLGVLKGGLYNISDIRDPLTKADVAELAVETTRSHLDRKRTGLSKIPSWLEPTLSSSTILLHVIFQNFPMLHKIGWVMY